MVDPVLFVFESHVSNKNKTGSTTLKEWTTPDYINVIYMVLIKNTYCGNSILMEFTSRTYLKQIRNGLDGSGNMFCVLQPSLYTPFHYLNRIHPSPSSFVKISHTLALSHSLTHPHIHSLNFAQSHQLRCENYIPTINIKLLNTIQNKSVCMKQIRHKLQTHVLFCHSFKCSHSLAQSIHSQSTLLNLNRSVR